MSESNMSISVNGQSQVPPGFRFHPTEEELLQYYLKKKVSNLRIDLDVIRDIDLNKLEPWDIQEKCRIGTTPQNDWYFFSHKDKKYPTGTRTNRATAVGFWKATGRDKAISSNCRRIGMRKTLVFYKGRAPHGQKSDWIMHEYRLDDNTTETNSSSLVMIEPTQEEGWVVCRIFKKKSQYKTRDHEDRDSPVMSAAAAAAAAETMNNETISMSVFDGNSGNDQEGALEQIFQCMRRKKEETNNFNVDNNNNDNIMNNGFIGNSDERFLKLPRLESPKSHNNLLSFHHDHHQNIDQMINNWTALDRLVASQLNGQTTTCFANSNDDHDEYDCDQDHLQVLSHVGLRSFNNMIIKPNNNINYHAATQDYSNEIELWSFARSSSLSDPICHMSIGPL